MSSVLCGLCAEPLHTKNTRPVGHLRDSITVLWICKQFVGLLGGIRPLSAHGAARAGVYPGLRRGSARGVFAASLFPGCVDGECCHLGIVPGIAHSSPDLRETSSMVCSSSLPPTSRSLAVRLPLNEPPNTRPISFECGKESPRLPWPLAYQSGAGWPPKRSWAACTATTRSRPRRQAPILSRFATGGAPGLPTSPAGFCSSLMGRDEVLGRHSFQRRTLPVHNRRQGALLWEAAQGLRRPPRDGTTPPCPADAGRRTAQGLSSTNSEAEWLLRWPPGPTRNP